MAQINRVPSHIFFLSFIPNWVFYFASILSPVSFVQKSNFEAVTAWNGKLCTFEREISESGFFLLCLLAFWVTFFPAILWDFPGSSASKESTCNAGDPGFILGLGRSPGEGIGYPLQYSWVSLVAQMVKNPPAMQETWVWSLGWEDPLEEGMPTHSRILAWRIPVDRGGWRATVCGVTKNRRRLSS